MAQLVQYNVKLAPYARQMRQWSARQPLPRLMAEMQILDEIVRAQSLTIGVQPQVEIAVIAIGDEIQNRTYGRYPHDCLSFTL